MHIEGYKAFNADHTNRYNLLFEEGKTYDCNGIIKFGINGNGFHFCKRIEDTIRYFDGTNRNIAFAEVVGSGKIVESCDEYYGYYDMYACETIYIKHFLTQEEVLNKINEFFYNISVYRNNLLRFISGYKFNNEELNFILNKLKNINIYDKCLIMDAISYYQLGDKNIYKQKYIENEYQKIIMKK